MTENHHLLAKTTTDAILKKFKEDKWKCGGNIGKGFVRSGVESTHPSPDAAFYDHGKKIRVSFEFKPPTESKRGILTGLGQSVSYLNNSHISYLIVPKKLEGFNLEKYMKNIFSNQIVDKLPIGLITYENENPSKVCLIHNVGKNLLGKKKVKPIRFRRFWAKHIDQPIQLFHLILHCFYLKKIGIATDPDGAFAYCWKNFLINEKSLKTLEPVKIKHPATNEVIMTLGIPDKPKMYLEKGLKKAKSLSGKDKKKQLQKLRRDMKTKVKGDNNFKSATRKNLGPFLMHLGMIDGTGALGNLTDYGFKYYHLGWTHGPNSKIFQDYFLKCVLETGHHLDLIFDLDKLCHKYRGKMTTKEIKKEMEKDYEKKGMIERNLPRQTPGKKSKVEFLKYEDILWRSLDLVDETKPDDISFNWPKITEVISLPEL